MKILVFFVLIIMMSSFLNTFAQDQEMNIDEFYNLLLSFGEVTTPTAKSSLLKLSPGSVSVITAEQIENFGFDSIFEALRLVPGANVSYSMMLPQLGIRSIGENIFTERVHFLIDGVSYNSPDKGGTPGHPGHYNSFFPVEMIKQIEVIRGPTSAVWGTNAFSGVVNMVTKDLEGFNLTLMEGELAAQKYTLSYGHNDKEYKFSTIVSFQEREGPVRIHKEAEKRTAQIYLKGEYKDFSFNWFTDLSKMEPWITSGSTLTAPIEDKIYMATVAHNKEITENINLKTSFNYNTRRGSNCGACHNPNGIGPWGSSSPKTGWGEKYVQYRAKTQADYNLSEKHNIIAGFEATETKEDMVQNTRIPLMEGDWTDLSVYLQDEIKWLEKGNLTTNVGARFDWDEMLHSHHHTSIHGLLASPKFAVVYNPMEKLILRTSYSHGFRPAVMHEYQLMMPLIPSFPLVILGDNDLKPEEIKMTELGAEYFFTKYLSAKVDLFVSEIKNAIRLGNSVSGRPPLVFLSSPTETQLTYENNPNKFWISGGELEIDNHFFNNKLQTLLNYSYQDVGGKANRFNFPPPEAPRHKYAVGLNYLPFNFLKLNLLVTFKDNYFPSPRLATRTTGGYTHIRRNAHTLIDGKIDWIIPLRQSKSKLILSLIGNNLLDDEVAQYFNSGFDPSLAGRTAYFKASVDF